MDFRARGKGVKNKYSAVVSSIATNMSPRPKVTVKKHLGPKIQVTSRTPQKFVRHPKSSFSVPSIYIDEVTESEEHLSSMGSVRCHSAENEHTLVSSVVAKMPVSAPANNNANELMAVYRTVNCGLQTPQVAPSSDLRENLQLVESKLTNLEKRCRSKPSARRKNVSPVVYNTSESEVNSPGVSETSVDSGERKPYDPSRYEDKSVQNEEQARKDRVKSVRMEIQKWKTDQKKKTGTRKSQSGLVKSGTGNSSQPRSLSKLEKLELEYKQLQKVALERDRDRSWESIDTSRVKSSNVSVGIQSGQTSGSSIPVGSSHQHDRSLQFTSGSHYPLDDYITRKLPSPPRDNNARTALNDIITYEQTQRLLHDAKRTMFNLQADVSMEISNTDLGNGDLLKWNIKQLVNEKLQEIRPGPQIQQVMPVTTSTVERIWPPCKPPFSADSITSELHQDVLMANAYMDNAFKLALNVNSALNNNSTRSRPSSRDKKAKQKSATTETDKKGKIPCVVHPTKDVQPSNEVSASAGEQECICCVGCRTQLKQHVQNGSCSVHAMQVVQPLKATNASGGGGGSCSCCVGCSMQHGRLMTWDGPQKKPHPPAVRFVPIKGTTSNATVIEIKTLKNSDDEIETDKTTNLIVQELPKMSIRTECTVQKGPSINLPSTGKTRPEDNVGLVDVTHMRPLKQCGQRCDCEQPVETPFLFDVNHGECVNRKVCVDRVSNVNQMPLSFTTHPERMQDVRIANAGQHVDVASNEPTETAAISAIAAKLEVLEDRSLQQNNRMSEILKYLQNDIDLRLKQSESAQPIKAKATSPASSVSRPVRTKERMHHLTDKSSRISSRRTGGNPTKSLHKRLALKKSTNMLGNQLQTQQKQSPQKVPITNELFKQTNLPDVSNNLATVYAKNLNIHRDERNVSSTGNAWQKGVSADAYTSAAVRSRVMGPVLDNDPLYLCDCGTAVRCSLQLATREPCLCGRSRGALNRNVHPMRPYDDSVRDSARQSNVHPVGQVDRFQGGSQKARISEDSRESHSSRDSRGHAVHYPDNYLSGAEGHYRQSNEQHAGTTAGTPATETAETVAWPVGSNMFNSSNNEESTRTKQRPNSGVGGNVPNENINPSISTVLGVRQGNAVSSRYMVPDQQEKLTNATRRLSVATPFASQHVSADDFDHTRHNDDLSPDPAYVAGTRLFHFLGIPHRSAEAPMFEHDTNTAVSQEQNVHTSAAANAMPTSNKHPVSTSPYNSAILTENQNRNGHSVRDTFTNEKHESRSRPFDALPDNDAKGEQLVLEQSRAVLPESAALSGLIGIRSLLDRQLGMMKSDDLDVLRRATEMTIQQRREMSGVSAEGMSKVSGSVEREGNFRSLGVRNVDTDLDLRDFEDDVRRLEVIKELPEPDSRERDGDGVKPNASTLEEMLSTPNEPKEEDYEDIELSWCECSHDLLGFFSADNITDPTATSSSMSEGEVRSFGEVRARKANFCLDERSQRSVGEIKVPGKKKKRKSSVGESCACGTSCKDPRMKPTKK